MINDDVRPVDVAAIGRGMQPAHVRQANQRAILSVVSLQPGISNAELARVTSLAPQTISAILADLEAVHLIMRGDVRRGRRGQPATPVFMNPTGALTIGAEIGWRHLDVALVGIGTQVLARYRRDYTHPDPGTVFDEIAQVASDMMSAMATAERKRLVGLALAVPPSLGSGTLVRPSGDAGQHGLWRTIDIAASAGAATGLETTIHADGNAACWADRVGQPSPRLQNFVFLLIDTHVAAGIVAENRLWEGVTGASASLGSMLVTDANGAPRFVSDIASVTALETRLREAGLDLAAVQCDPIPAGARSVVDGWIADASSALAQVVVNTATVIEYEVAVVEAALPLSIREAIIKGVNAQIARLPNARPGRLRVKAGQLGRSGAAEGAALRRMYRRYFSRELQHMDN